MNSLVILALLVAAVSAAPRAPCPKSQSLLDIPDHQLSHVFYRCASGRPIRFECSHGLVYNPSRGVCDFVRRRPAMETTSSPATVSSVSTSQSTIVDGPTPPLTSPPTASTWSSTIGTPTSTPVTVSSTTTSSAAPGQTPSSTTPPPAHSSTASTVTTLSPPTGTTTSPATVAPKNFRRPYAPRFLRKRLF